MQVRCRLHAAPAAIDVNSKKWNTCQWTPNHVFEKIARCCSNSGTFGSKIAWNCLNLTNTRLWKKKMTIYRPTTTLVCLKFGQLYVMIQWIWGSFSDPIWTMEIDGNRTSEIFPGHFGVLEVVSSDSASSEEAMSHDGSRWNRKFSQGVFMAGGSPRWLRPSRPSWSRWESSRQMMFPLQIWLNTSMFLVKNRSSYSVETSKLSEISLLRDSRWILGSNQTMYSVVADVVYELCSILRISYQTVLFLNDQTEIGWHFAILRMPRSERVTALQEFRGKLHLTMYSVHAAAMLICTCGADRCPSCTNCDLERHERHGHWSSWLG